MASGISQSVVVVGGGIVGLSSAIWLARFGAKVWVVDRNPIGDPKATSFGNAGVLAACSVVPVTTPGLVPKSPKLVLDPNFPLFLRWSYLPRLAPWLVKYLSHANDADTRRIAHGLAPLIHDSVDQHLALVDGTTARDWVAESNYAFAYPNRAAFEADSYTWELRKAEGFEPEIVEGAALRDFEPALSADMTVLAVMKDHGFIRDPSSYLESLKKTAEAEGVIFVQAEVVDFDMSDGQISAVVTTGPRLDCNAAVLAAGVWSKPLAKKLGLKVPIESERGYHIEFKDAEGAPQFPIMVTTGKFVATPMANGLRCAGTVEFGGLDAAPSRAPIEFIRKQAKKAFPDLKAAEESTWMGHRPAPTDSLPVIGEIRGSGVFTGFGHHHIGLTAGPKTGRILAGLIAGNKQNIDLSPYRPDRFGAGTGATH